MDTEFEATFINISKTELREKLKKAEATLVRDEFMQKRVVLDLPSGHEIPGGWLRVRDEGNKITLTLKVVDGNKIENQKEISIKISDFNQTVSLLEMIGCKKNAYQESKRELWKLGETEITIDEWPFLEPFVEIEGKSEAAVKEIANLLGFEYDKALFCSVDTIYSMKYGISTDTFNHTLKILFTGDNPFLK